LTDRKPVAAVPAATVLLLRDGAAGLEIFMVLRSSEMNFAAGALVFPGGKLDPEDADPALQARCAGLEGLDELHRGLRVAVVRETFEECGVLLARPHGSSELVDADHAAAVQKAWRKALHDGEVGLREIVEREQLDLATDLLAPFAHWITPVVRPRRFDTYFYLAPVPHGQEGLHEGVEATDSLWVSPAPVLAEVEAGVRPMMFPTRANLDRLARSRTAAEAIAAARATPVVTIQPVAHDTPEGEVVRIPAGLGYDFIEMRNRGPWMAKHR